MKISNITVDVQLIEQGDWIGEIPLAEFAGVRLKVRGTGNVDYRRLQTKLLRASATTANADNAEATADKHAIELLHQTVLLDWDGIFEEDEKTPLRFSSEKALELLSDPGLSAFRAAVTYAANHLATRRKAKPTTS